MSEPQPAHPWIRLIARNIDLLAAVFTVGSISGAIFRGRPPVPLLALTIASMLAWVFLEAVLLALFGTTPGKAMLSVSVQTPAGAKPGFFKALSRSLKVWIHGQGLWLPIISFVTHVGSYAKLKSDGRTTWDEDCSLRVIHGPWTARRILTGLVAAPLYVAILVVTTTAIMLVVPRPRGAMAALPPALLRQPARPTAVSFVPKPRVTDEVSAWGDPRARQLVGDWIITVVRPLDKTVLEWTNTLSLRRDGTFRQTVRVTEPGGVAHPELDQDWSGNWSFDGDDFVETVRQSTTPQHASGTWRFKLAAVHARDMSMQRQSGPNAAALTDKHPVYHYHKVSAPGLDE